GPGAHVSAPVRNASAGAEGEDGQSVAVGRHRRGRLLQRLLVLQAEPIGEPSDHVATFAQRPAEHEAPSIEAVDEGSPGNGDALAFENHSHRARRSDRGADPAWAAGPRPDLGEPTIAEGEIPRNLAKVRPAPRDGGPAGGWCVVPLGE